MKKNFFVIALISLQVIIINSSKGCESKSGLEHKSCLENYEKALLVLENNPAFTDFSTMAPETGKPESGQTLLHNLVVLGKKDDIETLLNSNMVDVDIRDINQTTPLINAAYYGHPHIVTLLLENKADVKLKNNAKRTALDYAKEQRANTAAGKRPEYAGMPTNYRITDSALVNMYDTIIKELEKAAKQKTDSSGEPGDRKASLDE